MIKIFDYSLRGRGEELVVIETGIGNSFYEWYPLVESLEDQYRFLLYHRRGYGRSKKAREPRNTENISHELRELVDFLAIDRFIAIGHSFGGLCLQHFALLYPERLKGLILLDSTSYRLKELDRLDTPEINKMNSLANLSLLFEKLSGLSREELEKITRRNNLKYREITGEDYPKVVDFFSNPLVYKTVSEELSHWHEDAGEIGRLKYRTKIPLRVVARDKYHTIENWIRSDCPNWEAIKFEEKWRELQLNLLSFSKDSQFIEAKGSDHMIHLDSPGLIEEVLSSLTAL